VVSDNVVFAGDMKDADMQATIDDDVNCVTQERVETRSSTKTAEDVNSVLTVGENDDFGVRSGVEWSMPEGRHYTEELEREDPLGPWGV